MKNQSTASTFSVEFVNKRPFNVEELPVEIQSINHTVIESKTKRKNECIECKKTFSTLGNMRNHYLTIHQNYRPYKCEFPGCSKRYSILSRYQVHLRTHEGKKPFLCQICNKSFNEKGNLKTHLRFHSEKRPFKCSFCTKCYKTNGHLKDHIEIQHKKIKKYMCETCEKRFGRISTLKAHIRTHTGERNFKCKIEGCNKYFAEKGNMEIHYKRHLKKLNKLNELEEKETKKNYGQKEVKLDFEEKIQEAIDNLKDLNNYIVEENKTAEIKNKKLKKVKSINNLLKDNNTIQNSVSQTNNYIINNTIIETPKTKENNMDKNNNKEQNFFILNKENQNYITFSPFILAPEQQSEQLSSENKNESKFYENGGITRPESGANLANNELRDHGIFVKDEDLENDEDNNFKQNLFPNENSPANFNFNCFIFLGNQPIGNMLNNQFY